MLRKAGYLFIVLIWLLVMSLPVLAFVLAARGELMVGSDQGSNLRLFMVNTDEAEGIGVQRVRKARTQEGCLQGSVRYLLWEGQNDGLNVDYCTCEDPDTGSTVSPTPCDDR